MFRISKRSIVPRLAGILLSLLLLGQIPVGIQAAPLAQNSPQAPVDCDDTGCPASSFGLPYCIEEPNFCVYYDTDYVTELEAEFARDVIDDHWDLWAGAPLNFTYGPKYSGKLEVALLNDNTCNGYTGWSAPYMTTYAGCFDDGDIIAQMVLGHELTHRLQYNYDRSIGAPIQTKFLKEGSARATQDNWFTDKDEMPAPGFTYCSEAASYLASTNVDLSSLWYKACVWWKFAMEQYGTIVAEPYAGVDFVEEVYLQNELGHSSIAAVNQALSAIGLGIDFDDSFTQFAVTAYTKDLTGLPDDSYDIIDEDQPPGQCGTVTTASGGTIQVGADATWNNHSVSKYGIRYYEADIGANCPIISVSFHRDGASPAFYHAVTQNGNVFGTHKQGSGADWTQAFLNDGVTKVVAVAGSLDSGSQVDVTLECADPDLDIIMPNAGAVARVQASSKFLAQLMVTSGGAPVAGLASGDFTATVNGSNAPVTGGGYIQEGYWLVVQAPAGLADGLYDLEVSLEDPGGGAPLASDTEIDSVEYTLDRIDQVLVIDRSGSMGMPIMPDDYKILAAKDAANFYVDITRNHDGLAVVAYNHNVSPAPFDMAEVNSTVRTDAKTYINTWSPDGIYPAGATSIGDGLDEAVNQRGGSLTGNPHCSFVLLSDGYENSSLYWADVQASVQATGCPVTSIAFGPHSNELLMQDIAAATGGLFFYNDVYISGVTAPNATTAHSMTLDLIDTYEYAEGRGEGRQRLLSEQSTMVEWGEVHSYTLPVDDSISEMLFALSWYERYYGEEEPDQYFIPLELELVTPSGAVIDHDETMSYTFPVPIDWQTEYVGWRIPNPEQGQWQMVVKSSVQYPVAYQVLASGQSNLTLELLLPDRLGTNYWTGNRFPIYAILSNNGPIPNVPMEATVLAPGLAGCPTIAEETMVPLYDDGEHGDGAAGDGVYANTYTRVNCADELDPPTEPGADMTPTPQDEGGYRVSLRAMGTNFQREAKGAFSVLEGPDEDNDGLPDPWEEENDVDDPNANPDLDCVTTVNLTNLGEYLIGTDPHNSDVDGGGENDFSDALAGQDPFDPADDQIRAPDFFQAAAGDGEVLLTYDAKAEYTQMLLFRATSPDGPWDCANVQNANLDLGGADTDPADNGTTYYYRLVAVGTNGRWSAALDSEPVTPSTDPVLPQAFVIINDGAPSTMIRDVTLSFMPYQLEEGDPDSFSDIVAALISNDPSLADAQWQTIDPNGTVPWTLGGFPNATNYVYVRFRDHNDNESVGVEVGAILYDPHTIYLPLVLKDQ